MSHQFVDCCSQLKLSSECTGNGICNRKIGSDSEIMVVSGELDRYLLNPASFGNHEVY